MKKVLLFAAYFALFIFFISCSTNNYRPLSEISNPKIIGNIQTTFKMNIVETTVRGETVYLLLLEAAKKEYHGNIDIRDITWSKTKTLQDPATYVILGSEYIANGKVVLLDDSNYNVNVRTGIEGSLARAAEQIMSSIQKNSIIAIVYVMSPDLNTIEFITNELEFLMVNRGFTIVDRKQLDKIRQEQNFQLSGEINDDTAVSIGKIVGANIIITGSVTGTDATKRLRLRALNTETAQVMAAASEQL
jgi:hypothetical protein